MGVDAQVSPVGRPIALILPGVFDVVIDISPIAGEVPTVVNGIAMVP